MPGYNRTGPAGRGPMTGRGQGLCRADRASNRAGIQAGIGVENGIGLGRGFRCGRGWGRRYDADRRLSQPENVYMGTQPESLHSEIDRLKTLARSMQQSLDATNRYIAKMEKTE